MDTLSIINQAQNGDKASRDRVVMENTGLIWSVVKRFMERGYEKEDLFQIGSIGLIKAVDRFDTTLNVAFSTYAVPLIMGEIRRFIRDDGIIKISRTIKENQYKVIKTTELLQKSYGREPTVEEVAKESGLSGEDVLTAMEARGCVESIYKENQESGTIIEIGATSGIENEIIERVTLDDAINSLSSEEKEIIKLRYYKNKTQSEIGCAIGKSQVQISRIEKNILIKLRSIIQ